MTGKKKLGIGAAAIIGLPAVTWLVLWIWLLSAKQPLQHPLASYPLWPVACSTRGCVTSSSWLLQHQLQLAFAQALYQDMPSPEKSLTTAVRQHILAQAFLRSPVTVSEAKRYREEVLHISDREQLKNILDLPLADYDTNVILPLLQQEALRQERKTESREELYGQLSKERLIILLPFQLRWNKDSGEAVRR